MFGMHIVEPVLEPELPWDEWHPDFFSGPDPRVTDGGIVLTFQEREFLRKRVEQRRKRNRPKQYHFAAEFTFGAMELCTIKYYRRLFVEHGGVYREYYAQPGISWDVEFRTEEDRYACCKEAADDLNGNARSLDYSAYTPEEFFREIGDRPRVRHFEIVNGIDYTKPVRRHRPSHPIRG